MKLRLLIVATVMAVAASVPSAGRSAGVLAASSTSLPVWDDFSGGFTVGTPTAKWFYFQAGSYIGDDGITKTGPHGGLAVVPTGTNPTTGLPAFVRTLGQEQLNGGLPGGLDHVKWLVYMNHTASSGYPGFDAVPGQELVCQATLSGQTFGTSPNPFCAAAPTPSDDLRLAGIAMNVIDFQTYMVFDVWYTDTHIYAFYEHLPFGRKSMGGSYDEYAAFSYAIPIASRTPGDVHTVAVAYDKAAGTVRWSVDGSVKFSVGNLGYRIARRYMLLDHGGTEEHFSPKQLDCGMGMFTLLDGHGPLNKGLVRLSSAANFYFNPAVGAPRVETFVDDRSRHANRIFGQGAVLHVQKYQVGLVKGEQQLPSTGMSEFLIVRLAALGLVALCAGLGLCRHARAAA